MGGAKKWPENEVTVLKVGGLVALFPGHVEEPRSGLRMRLHSSEGCQAMWQELEVA